MNFHFGNKSNTNPTALVAVALKSTMKELPTIIVHDKTLHSSTPIVFSHLSPNMNITNMTFLYKGKFLAALVEVEPRLTYNLSVWVISSPSRIIYSEEIKAHCLRLEPCLMESSVLTLCTDAEIRVYTLDGKGEIVNHSADKSAQITNSIRLDLDDCIVDHCWLKGENRLIVCSRYKLFVFEGSQFEEEITFEFPPQEMKRLVKDKATNPTQESLYQSIEYVIEYMNKVGNMDRGKKLPEMLQVAIESELSQQGLGDQIYENIKDDQKRAILKTLYSKFNKLILEERKIMISCLCRQENGFAVGFRGIGMVAIYKRKKDNFALDSTSMIKNKYIQRVCFMASAHDDNHIVVTVKLRSRFVLEGHYEAQTAEDDKEGSVEIIIFNSSLVNTIKNSTMEPFEFLYPFGSHSSGVLDLVLPPTKSFAASMSKDKTLKLWQYGGDQKQIASFEFSKYEFSKHELSFDIHPLGLQVAIGFKEGLKIYFLVEGEINPAYENFERACHAVSYSSRGHLLAIGYGSEIHLIDPYSFDHLKKFKQHSNDMRSLSWVGRDRYLVSLCVNSSFNVWDSHLNFKSILDDSMVNRVSKINAVAYDPEFDLFVCCCSDSYLRVYNQGKVDPYADFETGEGVVFTSVLISKKLQVIFFGTNLGSVRIYLWPLIKLDRVYDSTQMFIHLGSITSIKITPNYEYLVTTAEDSSIYFLKIKELQKGKNITMTDALNVLNDQKDTEVVGKISNAFSLNEFSLMSNAMQRDMLKRMNELESDLQNKITEIDEENEKLTTEHNMEIHRRENENQEELKKMNILLATSMDEEGSKQKNLELQCKEFKTKLKEMIKKKEEDHRQQLLKLYAERDQIEKEMAEFREKKDTELLQSNDYFNREVDEMKGKFDSKKLEINKKYAQAIFYLKEDQKKFKEALKQSEEEYNILIDTTTTDLKNKVENKKKQTEILRSKQSKLKKDQTKNSERVANLQKLITETRSQNSQLENDIKAFRLKYQEMEKRLNEQEHVINFKESKIKEYRNKNYHLQNFKSVYDYQVTTLKEAHEPLTEYVDNLEVDWTHPRNTSRRCITSCSVRQMLRRLWRKTSSHSRMKSISSRTM